MGTWKADIIAPGKALLRRETVETLAVCDGCWYDIRKSKRWDNGNVAKVLTLGAEAAYCEVYAENKRRHGARKLLGEFTIPYASFESAF